MSLKHSGMTQTHGLFRTINFYKDFHAVDMGNIG